MTAVTSHRRGEHVRHTVLAAAFDELTENGLARATVAGVARRSGVHETTIYRRWVTRENLFVNATLARSADEIPAPDTGSTRGDLIAIVRAVTAYVSTPAGRAALHAAAVPLDDAYPDARAAFWAGRLHALRRVVERGIARGDLRPDTDPGLLLETLVAPVHGRLLFTGEPVDDALAESLVNLVLRGAAA
ncbi:TetR/AcrR family transcriptional regulator [Candidatus Mycolicibacterium alkanivorans]|uniref:TetR/AcrR family transcriptional regulator n=1 Tax=Candidatus Mycolicibacterium alkanivorans TaxID=2954114 RepID=A0ABS9YVD1_9MYCO|nr:TetR/AcrR family transcriptional regulator [Candidatus Mycolicibacterium alkanivorans]MCI4675206.1 TetR/AcrR family transcriptional regulator [Candidatus Mycolicibacterium alkanivorans]MCI4675963.1 TetR/AcrR family transcriptional regulator [Candidatus Mycolicibacterium alkanivorans]